MNDNATKLPYTPGQKVLVEAVVRTTSANGTYVTVEIPTKVWAQGEPVFEAFPAAVPPEIIHATIQSEGVGTAADSGMIAPLQAQPQCRNCSHGLHGYAKCAKCDCVGTYRQAQPQDDSPVRAFAKDVLRQVFEGLHFDGSEIQESALKHGLLRQVVATERCGEACICAEINDFPTDCYRFTELLTAPTIQAKGNVEITDEMVERALKEFSSYHGAGEPARDDDCLFCMRAALEAALNG